MLLFVYNCFVLWAAVFLLAAASGVDIYTQAFAIYFLLEIGPLLQAMVRIDSHKCRSQIKSLLDNRPKMNRQLKCEWLSGTFLAVMYLLLYAGIVSAYIQFKLNPQTTGF